MANGDWVERNFLVLLQIMLNALTGDIPDVFLHLKTTKRNHFVYTNFEDTYHFLYINILFAVCVALDVLQLIRGSYHYLVIPDHYVRVSPSHFLKYFIDRYEQASALGRDVSRQGLQHTAFLINLIADASI